jgi:hypothetical protein
MLIAAVEQQFDTNVSVPVTLTDARDLGIVKGTMASLRNHRARDPRFPKPIRRGHTHYYDALELADWQQSRMSQGDRVRRSMARRADRERAGVELARRAARAASPPSETRLTARESRSGLRRLLGRY